MTNQNNIQKQTRCNDEFIDDAHICAYIGDMLGELSALAAKTGQRELHNMLVMTQHASKLSLK